MDGCQHKRFVISQTLGQPVTARCLDCDAPIPMAVEGDPDWIGPSKSHGYIAAWLKANRAAVPKPSESVAALLESIEGVR